MCNCDNVEGNLCQKCEAEQKEVRASMMDSVQQIIQTSVDHWWPDQPMKRSINSLTGVMPEGYEYV